MTALSPLKMPETNSLGRLGDDLEEMYSIGSVSPCPVEEPEPESVAIIRAGETTTTTTKLQENGLPLHVSPLEAIRELDEAEEALSGLRSPGDGAVRAKDPLGTTESPRRGCAEREMDELALEDCEEEEEEDDEGAPRPVLKTLRAIITSEDRVHLDTPHTETHMSSPHDVSDIGGMGEGCLKYLSQTLVESGMLGTGSSLQRTVVVIGSEMNDVGSSVQELKGRHLNSTVRSGLSVGSAELRNSTGSVVAPLEESPAVRQSQDGVCASSTGECAEAGNRTLIDILTACQTKVEQLEQLKCSSFELTVQLQCARALAARLQQQVLDLELERCGRLQEVQGLQEELREARRALQERSSHAARVSEELRLLRLQRDKRSSASGSSEVQEPPNGHACRPTTGPDHGPSRMCTLL